VKFNSIRALLLDLDGVVYIENRLLPGVAATIAAVRRRGIRAFFITNNAYTTRAGFARRLARLGVPCRPSEMMNAAHAAAVRLKRRFPRGTRFFVFGRKGLARELVAAGFRPVTVRTREEWTRFRRAPARVRAVVTGFSQSLTYWGLCAAHLTLTRGAELVACNLDSTYPIRGGTMPGTGSLVRLLETSSGRRPLLIGKPSPVMLHMLLRENGIAPHDALGGGDRLEIDIAAGRAGGIPTALVLTGISRRRDIARSPAKPGIVIDRLADLLRLPGFASAKRG